MKKLLSISVKVLLIVCVWTYHDLSAQVLTNSGSIHLNANTSVTIRGEFSLESQGSLHNDGQIIVKGNFLNNSNQDSIQGQGVVSFLGNGPQLIGGSHSSNFYDLAIGNHDTVFLQQGIYIDHQMKMDSGNVKLNGQIIVLGESAQLVGESDSSRIFGGSGEIQTTRVLDLPLTENVAGLGLEITSDANWDTTVIRRGHAAQPVGMGMSIERYFDVHPNINQNLNATLVFHYFPSELNGQHPDSLRLFRLNNGAINWTPAKGFSDVQNLLVWQSGIDSMALWTLSADGTTSIDDLRPALSVQYYPNPIVSGQALHLVGLERGDFRFSLFDVRGRNVLDHPFRSAGSTEAVQIPLPALSLGLYSIHILSEDYRPMVGKLLVHKH